MDPGVIQAIEIGAKLVPALVSLVQGLIEAGMSPDEAEAVVRKDITSRLADYKRAKAEDERALEAKHGIAPNPYDDPDGA